MSALYHHHLNSSNLKSSRWGLGRSEPDISVYSRLANQGRRGSIIQDIFNGDPAADSADEHRESYQKFSNEKSRRNTSRYQTVDHDDSSDDSGTDFRLSQKKTPKTTATHKISSKITSAGQTIMRTSKPRRKSGVLITSKTYDEDFIPNLDVNNDSKEEVHEDNLIVEKSHALLQAPVSSKDFSSSHEELFASAAERKRRFWEFMKSREQVVQYDVFISYNHESKPFALNLYKTLKHTYKYKVFIDKQLASKQKLMSALDEALRNTKVVVSVVTDKYSKSKNCCAEVSLANNLGIPIVPLVIEDLPPHKQNPNNFWPPEGEMSLPFSPLLYIDFRNYRDEVATQPKLRELKKRIQAGISQNG